MRRAAAFVRNGVEIGLPGGELRKALYPGRAPMPEDAPVDFYSALRYLAAFDGKELEDWQNIRPQHRAVQKALIHHPDLMIGDAVLLGKYREVEIPVDVEKRGRQVQTHTAIDNAFLTIPPKSTDWEHDFTLWFVEVKGYDTGGKGKFREAGLSRFRNHTEAIQTLACAAHFFAHAGGSRRYAEVPYFDRDGRKRIPNLMYRGQRGSILVVDGAYMIGPFDLTETVQARNDAH